MKDQLNPEVFRRELAKMVQSPAWPQLVDWWTEQLVRRVLSQPVGSQSSDQAAAVVERAGAERAGGVALLLAIENEVTRSQQEAMHVNRSRISRAAAKAADQRQGAGSKRAGRAGKQAATKEGGTG